MKVKETKKRSRKERKSEQEEREEDLFSDFQREDPYENLNLNRIQNKVRFSKSIKTQSFKLGPEPKIKKRSNVDPENEFYSTMKSAPTESKSFENLQYGSHIILSVSDKVGLELRKLSTKLRISEKLIADVMEESEYNINCMFCVLPSCQYVMIDKILSIVEDDTIPENIDVEFENFASEVDSNSTNYHISIGKSVKYEETFQLYQDSSKRYLAFYNRNVQNIDKIFDDQFFGDECYYLGFSEYPGSNTHFKFETVANYQSEIDGCVKRDHYVYLTAVDQMKTHYLYSIEDEVVLTETHKTPISFKVIRDGSTLHLPRTISRSNVFLISFANDNFYLNALHELNKKTGEYYQKSIHFQKWHDINNIDFNGWWQIEVLDVSNKAIINNFNSGMYLAYTSNNPNSQFDLVHDKENATKFELKSIINDNNEVSEFTENEIFKIKIFEDNSNSEKYILIEETNTSDLFFEENDFDDDFKKCIISQQSKQNMNDSFKVIIPKEEKYLEISICIDSREYIQLFIDKLEISSDFLNTLTYVKERLSKDFIKILEFIQNQLPGKVRSDFTIGQLVPHRQDMVAKVGIIFQICKLLTLIATNLNFNENRDKILSKLAISPVEFDKFENLLEVIIKTLDLILVDNPRNITQCQAFVNTIQEFCYVRGCTDLLINIFKNKEYELNRKEIHSEFIYKRIYEIEKFNSAIMFFTENMMKEREHRYIRLLRKFCVINENPLPLVQNEILNKLYLQNSESDLLFKLISDNNNDLQIQYKNLYQNKINSESIQEFLESEDINSQSCLFEQITLEADLCYGRNEKCKEFFKQRYPLKWLITHVSNTNYNIELRGVLLRLINYIYIDDNPHKLQKLVRIFKGNESPNKHIQRVSSHYSQDLSQEILSELISFLKNYIHIFALEATGINYIKGFDLELIRLLRYLLRFGIITYRDGNFQSEDIDYIFSYLCHIIDFYTQGDQSKSSSLLNKLISKDTVQINISDMDPFTRSGHDIKYRLFNKNFLAQNDFIEERNHYKDKCNSNEFHSKILKEVIFIFHFFSDMRQHYLMSNNIEFFYKEIFEKSQKLDINEDNLEELIQILKDEFSYLIPNAKEFHNHLSYELPNISRMYEK